MRILMLVALGLALIAPAHGFDASDWKSWRTAYRAAENEAVPALPAVLANVPSGRLYRGETGLALAMFSAGNAVAERYVPYLADLEAPRGLNADAAAAAAGCAFIERVYGGTRGAQDACALRDSLFTGLPRGERRAARRFGAGVAEAILERMNRKIGPRYYFVYEPVSPGRYAPVSIRPSFEANTDVAPWVVEDIRAAWPEGPPALDSQRYADGLAEVRAVGRYDSQSRTAEQARAAEFYAFIGYDTMIDQFTARRDLPLPEEVRIAAVVGAAHEDATLVGMHAKLHFLFWRPIVAIRRAELDGLPATEPDAGWRPYLTTPSHPEYPCGHCYRGAAIAAALEAVAPLDEGETIDVFHEDRPEDVDTLASYAEFSRRMSESRIWGGVHYRFTTDDSDVMGRRIAAEVISRFGMPVGD